MANWTAKYGHLAGLKVPEAREKVFEELTKQGILLETKTNHAYC